MQTDSYQKRDAVSLNPLFLFLFFLSFTQGEELRRQIGAAAYIECSSKTQQVVAMRPVWGMILIGHVLFQIWMGLKITRHVWTVGKW